VAKHIEEAVEAIVQEIVQDSNLEVVDVEYVKDRDWYLRVYLDKEGGIEIDDCQRVSETLEQILDEKDLLTEAYILEVSSPGLDRVLKKARDFEREQGKAVDVTFYAPVDGKKTWVGTLTGYDPGKNAIALDGEKELPLEKIVLETDCPYLTPVPFRGKRNEPGRDGRSAAKSAAAAKWRGRGRCRSRCTITPNPCRRGSVRAGGSP